MGQLESVFVDIKALHEERRRSRRMRWLLAFALLIIYFQWQAIGELRQEIAYLKSKSPAFTTIIEKVLKEH